MRVKTLGRLLGLDKLVVEDVWGEDVGTGAVLVVGVRPAASQRLRCPLCRRRCGKYDDGSGVRRWRHLDAGATKVFVQAAAPRVRCARHGVVVAAVPWARHGSGHTRMFDDQVAWLATRTSKSAVCELMRVGWRTVGAIVGRVWQDVSQGADLLGGLSRIGVDEISYKKGQKYLVVVVDHDSSRLVWAGEGRSAKTLVEFFDLLGPQRCARITHVSADSASWVAKAVRDKCPHAVLCADPYHVVSWAMTAMDQVRRDAWRQARQAAGPEKRRRGRPPPGAPPRPNSDKAASMRNSRWALWKNPENLTEPQQAKLEWIAKTDSRLYRAYLLKEGLRTIFRLPCDQAWHALNRWISWARRCRIPSFVALQKTIVAHKDQILNTLQHRLSNGLIESINTKIRLITRVAFGFHSPHSLIALAMLSLGGLRPNLPGRQHPPTQPSHRHHHPHM